MEEHGIIKRVWQYQPQGTTSTGRPLKSLLDQNEQPERTDGTQIL